MDPVDVPFRTGGRLAYFDAHGLAQLFKGQGSSTGNSPDEYVPSNVHFSQSSDPVEGAVERFRHPLREVHDCASTVVVAELRAELLKLECDPQKPVGTISYMELEGREEPDLHALRALDECVGNFLNQRGVLDDEVLVFQPFLNCLRDESGNVRLCGWAGHRYLGENGERSPHLRTETLATSNEGFGPWALGTNQGQLLHQLSPFEFPALVQPIDDKVEILQLIGPPANELRKFSKFNQAVHGDTLQRSLQFIY